MIIKMSGNTERILKNKRKTQKIVITRGEKKRDSRAICSLNSYGKPSSIFYVSLFLYAIDSFIYLLKEFDFDWS